MKNLRAWRQRQDMNSLLGPPLEASGLGGGQPRTKVTVSLLPWKRPPLNREPEKRWRKGVPGPPGVRTEKMREIVSTGSRSTSLTASLRALYTLGAEYMAFKEREV